MLICSNAYVIIHFEIRTSVDQKTDGLQYLYVYFLDFSDP